MKVQNLKRLKAQVHTILIEYPKTRKDDFLLVKEVMKNYADTETLSFDFIMANHKCYELPSFAGITRARRKIQEEDPSLKDEQMSEIRKEIEDEFVKFARDESL